MLFVFKIFKMATNIEIKKMVKNSKMNIFQRKWIFTGSKTCCTIWRPFWFAMVAILNQKWPPKYKNPPIWAKFSFQVDYEVLVLFVWGTFVTLCVTVTNILLLFCMCCYFRFFLLHVQEKYRNKVNIYYEDKNDISFFLLSFSLI